VKTVTIEVANGILVDDKEAPEIAITFPAAFSKVSGNVVILADAIDNVGIKNVEFYIDGKLAKVDTSETFAYEWNTMAYTNDMHTLLCKAVDTSDNIGASQIVTIEVNN